ncbi:TolB-like translocation protein [Ichthyenterobacterium magnum]|uniref:WD40 repeat protein n=1 Tax=Ichthyenterobacterium magnum TaxID=1230530 RepID=A0A420DV50_9FLAO|nr:PD40 domain-containing protein [Ichthyenterobacterium magnum]RKE98030.1 WD40 repeat protein [Ichthyenterobacterium magnum]
MKQFILYFIFIVSFFSFAQPKEVPTPFLENVVKQFPNVRDIALTKNQDEVVFSAQSFMGDMSALIACKRVNGIWQAPELISFSGQYFDIEPFFSKDGLKLFFASNRPIDASSNETKDFDIWYVTRKSKLDDWSKPINLGAPINTTMDEFYPVITDSKNIYFTLDNPKLKQKDNIYVSEYINGSYTNPKSLGNEINSDGYEFNAFVAPDETFIIYTCYNRKDGLGSGDLYLSKKQDDRTWSVATNMGEKINSNKMDYCPFVDITSNTLYFTSKRLGNHTKLNSKSIEDLQSIFNQYNNGLSRLYKVKLD